MNHVVCSYSDRRNNTDSFHKSSPLPTPRSQSINSSFHQTTCTNPLISDLTDIFSVKKGVYEVVEPAPRKSKLPPLPDLRFEQSYLASLQGSQDWKVIGYITVRDQVRTRYGVEVPISFPGDGADSYTRSFFRSFRAHSGLSFFLDGGIGIGLHNSAEQV